MIATHWLFGFGPESEENLDRPTNNFDIAGVPQGRWFDGIFACYKNILPSCILSFCCPCILWAQVVIRSQIPLLIAVKNSSALFRDYSGYGFFMNSLLISFILFFIFLLTGIFVPNIAYQALGISIAFIIFMFILFVMGHVRTAFKMKYSIPSALPVSCEFFDMVLDAVVSVFCLPCATSQMARHVFQYHRWSPSPSVMNIFKDPYGIPPLEVMTTRYPMADRAGLVWLENAPLPTTESQQGSAHRPPHVIHRLQQQQQQQQQDVEQGGGGGGGGTYQQQDSTTSSVIHPVMAYAEPASLSSSPYAHSPLLYRPDGTLITSNESRQ